MQLKLNLNIDIKCELCGNGNDKQFYVMPEQEETLDGKYYSLMKYNFVCKKCRHKKHIKVSIEKGD